MSVIVPIELISAGGRAASGDRIEITIDEICLLRRSAMGTTRGLSRPRPTLRGWDTGDVEQMFTLEWLPAPARAKLRREAHPDDYYLAMRFGDNAGSETWLFRGDKAAVDSADAALQGKVLPVVLPDSATAPRRDLRPAPLLVLAGVLAVLGILSLLASRGSDGQAGLASASDPVPDATTVAVDRGAAGGGTSPFADGRLADITAGLTRRLGVRPTFERIEANRRAVVYDVQMPGVFDSLERHTWRGGEFAPAEAIAVAAPDKLRDKLFVESQVKLDAVPRLISRLRDLRPEARIQKVVIRRATSGNESVRIFINATENGETHQLRATGSGRVLGVATFP